MQVASFSQLGRTNYTASLKYNKMWQERIPTRVQTYPSFWLVIHQDEVCSVAGTRKRGVVAP